MNRVDQQEKEVIFDFYGEIHAHKVCPSSKSFLVFVTILDTDHFFKNIPIDQG